MNQPLIPDANNKAVLDSLFDEVDQLLRRDQFAEADRALNTGFRTTSSPDHSEEAQAKFLVRMAKVKLHYFDHVAAIQCVSVVSPAMRQLNAEVDAQLHLIEGFLNRRASFSAKRNGHVDKSIATMHQAIDCFKKAGDVASASPGLELLSASSELNRIYCEGAIANLTGSARQKNPKLVHDAICVEAEILALTAPRFRNVFPGLVVISDLADGAGLTPADVVSLTGLVASGNAKTPFAIACKSLGISKESDWPNLILDAVRLQGYSSAAYEPQFSPRLRTQALSRGVKFIEHMSESFERRQLRQSYLVHVEYALREFESGRDARWHQQLYAVKARLISINGSDARAPYALR